MAGTEEMFGIALEIHPDIVTLVPEKREEVTTEGGLDVIRASKIMRDGIKQIRDAKSCYSCRNYCTAAVAHCFSLG
jgi:pyridoxine 5-phosphate synthase